MSVIAGVFGALPPRRYSQSEITDSFVEFPGLRNTRRSSVACRRQVSRHLVLPLAYRHDRLRRHNEMRIEGCRPWRRRPCWALGDANLRPSDIDMIATATVTGVTVPIFGCPDRRAAWCAPTCGGCRVRSRLRGGAAGVARLRDYRGAPDDVAVLVLGWLCSLTYPAVVTVSSLVGTAVRRRSSRGGRRRRPALRAGSRWRDRTSWTRTAACTPTRIIGSGCRFPHNPAAAAFGPDEPDRTVPGNDVTTFLDTYRLTKRNDIGAW